MTDRSEYKLLRGGRVLRRAEHVAEPADVLVRGSRIESIGPPGLAAPPEAQVLDASDRLLVPGLVNAHTHGHGALARGSGDAWTLELLLNAGAWISGGRAPEHHYLSTMIAAMEMVQKGCTACYDLYLEIPAPSAAGMEAVARAYETVGMRAVIAPMLADRTLYTAVPGLLDAMPAPERARAEAIRAADDTAIAAACAGLLRDWPGDRDRIRPALAPTIPLHCSDALMVACRDLASEYDVGLHTHIAEGKFQVVSAARRYGKSMVAHLDDLGLLGPGFTAAHGVWLDSDDMARLAGHGASVAHNPGSNMRLGNGLAAVREMLDAGVNVGIGTDGASCSDHQNMFEAMRHASNVSRVRSHEPGDWLTAERILELATRGSARALGLGDDLGDLAPGALADIVLLDLASINFMPLNDPVHQLVHTEEGRSVDGVLVGGRVVYWNRAFPGIDVARVREEVDAAVAALGAANRELRATAAALEAHVSRYCVGLGRADWHVHRMAGAAH